MEIKFKRDTSFRKQFFVPDSFAHPAKMDAQLLIWIVEHYTEAGETILDPMAGMGTTMLACILGRDVVLVELEEKFCKMMRDNWEQVKMRPQLGSTMGSCQIIQGDARQLEGLLVRYDAGSSRDSEYPLNGQLNQPVIQFDKIVTSPPYAEADQHKESIRDGLKRDHPNLYLYSKDQAGSSKDNIGNLVYGDVRKVLQKGNRVFVDCGEAFFQLPSLSSQGESVLEVFASFSSKVIDKLQHKFSVFPLNLEEWNNLRQELLKVNILGHSIHINELPSNAVLFPNSIIKLREIISNPKACLFVTDSDLDMGTKPSILVFPLLDNKETPLAIKQSRHISQLNSIHQDNDSTNTPVCQVPYGEIDKCIFSPPYAESKKDDKRASDPEQIDKRATEFEKAGGNFHTPGRMRTIERAYAGYTEDKGNVGNLPYGQIDKIVTSPPYEAAVSASTGGERDMSSARQREKRLRDKGYDPVKYQGGVGRNLEVDFQYTKDKDNIGNLKSQSYLEAMLQVYQQCYKVLKPQGLMILVTKNFIRNKQVVRLDEDTIKLCEQAGFSFVERHYRELPSQSFWRVIYHQKFPDVEQIKSEDVLVFKKLTIHITPKC